MEEWLKKLLASISTPAAPTAPQPNPTGLPGAVGGQVPLHNPGPPAVQRTGPVNSPVTPQVTPPPNQVPSSPPVTTSANTALTPEQMYEQKLGQYNQVMGRDPKLAHTTKNNLLQGLFLGLQGVQRIADPANAPQGPLQYLGNARKQAELQTLAPQVQSLGAEVKARAAQRKSDLDAAKTQAQVVDIASKVQQRQYGMSHPGMETTTNDGVLYERPKGSTAPWQPAAGVKPPQRVPVVLPNGATVDVPGIDAVRFEAAQAEKEAEKAFQVGKINSDRYDDYRKELNDWSQKEAARSQQVSTWVNDGLSKSQQARELRTQAAGIAGTKEALDLNTKAAELEAEAQKSFNDAQQSKKTPKPTAPSSFTSPTNKKGIKVGGVSRAKDPLGLLSKP